MEYITFKKYQHKNFVDKEEKKKYYSFHKGGNYNEERKQTRFISIWDNINVINE